MAPHPSPFPAGACEGLRPRKKSKVLSVWCGGKAAIPNRQHSNRGGAAPRRYPWKAGSYPLYRIKIGEPAVS